MGGASGRGLRLLIFGAPGVGKGTQAAKIERESGLPHISTGEILRSAIREGSPLGKKVKEIIEGGRLIADRLVAEVVEERLARLDDRDGFLLDGYPRTEAQADLLDRSLEKHAWSIDRVINITVDEAVIIDRLEGRRTCSGCGRPYHVRFNPPRAAGICDACGGSLRQRDDDKPEAITRRLRAYRDQTAPLIGRYERAGLLLSIDGNSTPAGVFDRIIEALPNLKS